MIIYRLVFLSFLLSVYGVSAQDLYFPPAFSNQWETISHEQLGWCENEVIDFEAFLSETNTKGFLILKEGKIAMESYFDDFEVDSPWYWASAGKTMTAFLTGVLQQEGMVDINESTSNHLGEGWTSCDLDSESKITLKHQLTMTTGLDYITSNTNCIEPECLTCLNEPGDEWFYHNAPYTNISYGLETVTGLGYTELTNSKVASPIGFIGLWTSVDDNRVFFSTARGMAKFGLLMLAKGNWNGNQIMTDTTYFNAMISPSQSINEAYGYLWWLNGQDSYRLPGTTITYPGKLIPNAPNDLYAAIGKNGQICIVVPSEDIVIIRMGDNPDQTLVPLSYVRDLWDEYARLECTSSLEDPTTIEFRVYPRLTYDFINIESKAEINQIEIINRMGRRVMKVGKTDLLDVSSLTPGIYFVRVNSRFGSSTKRFVKF